MFKHRTFKTGAGLLDRPSLQERNIRNREERESKRKREKSKPKEVFWKPPKTKFNMKKIWRPPVRQESKVKKAGLDRFGNGNWR